MVTLFTCNEQNSLGWVLTDGGVHAVEYAESELIENVSEKHNIALACTHTLDATKLDVELVESPVSCPVVAEVNERPQQVLEVVVLARLHLNSHTTVK